MSHFCPIAMITLFRQPHKRHITGLPYASQNMASNFKCLCFGYPSSRPTPTHTPVARRHQLVFSPFSSSSSSSSSSRHDAASQGRRLPVVAGVLQVVGVRDLMKLSTQLVRKAQLPHGSPGRPHAQGRRVRGGIASGRVSPGRIAPGGGLAAAITTVVGVEAPVQGWGLTGRG